MSRAMNQTDEPPVPWLLDDDAWGCPDRLTDLEVFAQTGPGWRRSDGRIHDPEDVR